MSKSKGVNHRNDFLPAAVGNHEEKGATTYTLRNKGSDYNLSGSTILRLQAGESVSTNTLDTLCKILNCNLSDVAVFIPD